jgi:N-acetylmuramoyl-L-alanine amidase
MIELFNKTVTETIKYAFQNIVFIGDDGHGWETGGKRSPDGTLRENEFNSAMLSKLLLITEACGIEYYQLASGWKDHALRSRTNLENSIYYDAKLQRKRVVGISIHADAYPNTSVHGFSIHYWQKGTTYSREGKKFAGIMRDTIMASNEKHGYDLPPRFDFGIGGKNFHMLRETKGVWVLIENAFMTNQYDLELLFSESFRNNRTLAIFEGLYNYLTSA